MSEESNPLQKVRDQTVKALIHRAETDAEFRQVLLSDPHKAIERILGVNPLPGHKINIIQEKPGEINIVLPANLDESELPDSLLDLASGGVSFSAFVLYGPPYPDQKPKKR